MRAVITVFLLALCQSTLAFQGTTGLLEQLQALWPSAKTTREEPAIPSQTGVTSALPPGYGVPVAAVGVSGNFLYEASSSNGTAFADFNSGDVFLEQMNSGFLKKNAALLEKNAALTERHAELEAQHAKLERATAELEQNYVYVQKSDTQLRMVAKSLETKSEALEMSYNQLQRQNIALMQNNTQLQQAVVEAGRIADFNAKRTAELEAANTALKERAQSLEGNVAGLENTVASVKEIMQVLQEHAAAEGGMNLGMAQMQPGAQALLGAASPVVQMPFPQMQQIPQQNLEAIADWQHSPYAQMAPQ